MMNDLPANSADNDELAELREEYWWNSRTKEVEQGKQSLSLDRVGPFKTRAEAERAPEVLQERARKWAEEEAADR